MGSDFGKSPYGKTAFGAAATKGGAPATIERPDMIGESDFAHMDVYETADSIFVEIDLPGLSLADICVTVNTGVIVLEALKKDPPDPSSEKAHYLCAERRFGMVKRSIKLYCPINLNEVSAVYRQGALTIKAPKIIDRRNRARRIIIQGAGD